MCVPNMDDECCVCFEGMVSPVTLTPCGHRLCTGCVDRAILTRGMGCPLCRQTVIGVDAVPPPNAVPIRLGAGAHAGITVSDHRHGVYVRNVKRNDMAYRCGIRVGNVLTYVGGLPAVHHRDVVAQFDEAQRRGATVVVRRDRPGYSGLKWLRSQAVAFHKQRIAWVDGHTDGH